MDGVQVSNCTTELTGPTITFGLATPLRISSGCVAQYAYTYLKIPCET